MKAVIIKAYGASDMLQITDIPRPSCAPGQVLVRVKAAAVNPKDTFIRKGYFKQFTGDPQSVRMGFDFAGETSEIGQGVNDVQVDDEAYGMHPPVNHGRKTDRFAYNNLVLSLSKYNYFPLRQQWFHDAILVSFGS